MKTGIYGLFYFVLGLSFLGCGSLNLSTGDGGHDLLGLGPAEIIERLGVPDSIGSGIWSMDFYYPSEQGESEWILSTFDNCTYWVKPGFKTVVDPRPVPSTGAYPGQPIAEMIKRIGQPDKMFYGQNSVTLEYGNGMSIGVAHGLVVHVKTDE